MCRWIACSGGPIRLEELTFEPEHSLIDQSLEARTTPEAHRRIAGLVRDEHQEGGPVIGVEQLLRDDVLGVRRLVVGWSSRGSPHG